MRRVVNDAPIPCEWEIAVLESTVISVLLMRQPDDTILYKVSDGGRFALNVQTEKFEYESFPSNRKDNHAQKYRYADFDKACAAAKRAANFALREMEARLQLMRDREAGESQKKDV